MIKHDFPITVTASGFQDNDWSQNPYLSMDEWASASASTRQHAVMMLDGGQEVERLRSFLADITAVEIYFETAHDGRGFSLAKRLIEMGFSGQIRGAGALHVDQFPHAIQCGISALNLSREAALRMPEAYWIKTAASVHKADSYQARLGL